jgi:hypothetical protein
MSRFIMDWLFFVNNHYCNCSGTNVTTMCGDLLCSHRTRLWRWPYALFLLPGLQNAEWSLPWVEKAVAVTCCFTRTYSTLGLTDLADYEAWIHGCCA